MKRYKQLLENELTQHGWQVEQIISHEAWWIEESWNIQSIRENWGKTLVIAFLVDPLYEGEKKSSAVSEITASLQLPADWDHARLAVASLRLNSGSFNDELARFIKRINQLREC